MLSSLLVIFIMQLFPFPNKSFPVPWDLISNSVGCGFLLWVGLWWSPDPVVLCTAWYWLSCHPLSWRPSAFSSSARKQVVETYSALFLILCFLSPSFIYILFPPSSHFAIFTWDSLITSKSLDIPQNTRCTPSSQKVGKSNITKFCHQYSLL